MKPFFELIEKDLHPGCREIQVDGDLDLAVADRLKEAIDRAAAEECSRIVIGLQGCEFIDSTGIAVIVRAHNEMAERGGRVAAYGASSQVLRILSITGLTENGLIFDSAEEAIAAAPEPA